MLLSFFKVSFRNLWKPRSTSIINLLGLSIGMTAAVFILLWVANEFSYDNYHQDKDNIYRITHAIQISKEESWNWENSPMLLADFAKNEIPEIHKATRLVPNNWEGKVFSVKNRLFSEKTSAFVDPNWFDVFTYDFIEGHPADFSQNPYSIIITASKARKYFGNSPALGQVIQLDTVNYQVTGVIKDIPVNSSFQFDLLLQMGSRLANPHTYNNDKTWNNFGYITFIATDPGTQLKNLTAKLNTIIKKNRTTDNDKISLQPLSQMYFEEDLQHSSLPHGSRNTARIFSVLAVLLLLTACINYVNITTAKASLRAKEVSIRKITGAKRRDLFFQFITESFCISLLAILVTFTLIHVCLPVFNNITEKQFELPPDSKILWQVLTGTLVFAALFNGIYPAIMLSSFKPLNVFRGRGILKMQDGMIRKGLVVFQFSLSVVLIVGTLVIFRQLSFIQHTNPGYSVAQVVSMEIPYSSYSKLNDQGRESFFANIKNELRSKSAIASVCSGGSPIVMVSSFSSGNADWDGHDTTYNPTIAMLSVDEDFQQMFQVSMQSGKWFQSNQADENNYILNETAVSALHLARPILGQRFTWGGDTGRVIGIVKDFHFKSMHEKIGPMVLTYNRGNDAFLFIKTHPGHTAQAIEAAGKVWTGFMPNEPFEYTFLEDSFNSIYKSDIKTSRLILIFSVIAIIISALGLFGLAAFTAEQRTKEIGIRKVLGASIQQITTLLSKDFLKLVMVSILVGSPLAWLAMNRWLQDFAYRINLSAWIFLVAGAVAFLIAFVAVSFQSIKAAMANPAKSLNTE